MDVHEFINKWLDVIYMGIVLNYKTLSIISASYHC